MRPRRVVQRSSLGSGRSGGRAPTVQTAGGADLGRRHKPDYILLVLALILLGIGVVVIYAIGPALAATSGAPDNHYINRQLVAIVLSLIAFGVAATIPVQTWQTLKKPLLIGAAGVTLVALIMPVSPEYPAHRWVRLGTLSFQSVELLKFALLIWVASMLGERMRAGTITSDTNIWATYKPFVIILAAIVVIVAGVQSDLGSTVVMVAMIAGMSFAAGLPMKRILMIGGIVLTCLVIAIVATPYRRDRFATFLNPEADCQNTGYQACHAHIAVGSGGIIGQGLGNGAQAYGYLPEAENDAIFAIYAEKFGFVGVSVLIGVLIGLFARMRYIAERSEDQFARLVVVGVLVWLSTQAVMNIGAMLGLLPLKGITLPLVSYGGTSVVFVMTALGLVFHISRYTQFRISMHNDREEESHENRHDRRRLRGAYHATPSSRA